MPQNIPIKWGGESISKNIKGITIEIEGQTTGLNKALADVNKQTRDMQGELRQVERLLKLDPKNTELVAQKQKILGDAVSNSKEKLDRLRAAQEQVNQQFAKGEISEEQYRAFQREVAKTEQEVSRFEKQLAATQKQANSLGKALQDAGDKMKNAGDKMSGAGKKLSTTVTAPLVGAGVAMVALATKAGATADRLLDLRDITGMSTDAIQEWQYVAGQAGVKAEAVTEASEELTKQMTALENGTGKGSGALERLGISFTDLQAASPDQRIEMIVAGLQGIEDPALRAQLGTDLLKGSFEDMAPIIGMTSQELEEYRKKGNELAMNEDQLNSLNDFRKGMDDAKASIGAAGNAIAADLAPMLNDKLLPALQQNVIPALKDLGKKIGDVIKWFTDLDPKWQTVIGAAVGLAMVLGPLLIVLGAVASGIGAIVGVVGTLVGALPLLGAAFTFLTGPIGIAVVAIAGLIAAGIAVYRNWDTIAAKLTAIWNGIKTKATGIMREMVTVIVTTITRAAAKMVAAGKAIPQGLWDGIKSMGNWLRDQISTFVKDNVVGTVKNFLGIKSPSKVMAQFGKYIAEGLAVGIKDNSSKAAEEAQKMAQAITGAVQTMTEDISKSLSLSNARFDVQKELLGANADEAKKLTLELEKLTADKVALAQKTEILSMAYAESKKRLGENNATTKQYAHELHLAQFELKKMAASIKNTNVAIDEQKKKAVEAAQAQAKEMRTLADEVAEVAKKYRDDLVQATDDYRRKVAETNARMIADERNVTQQYNQELASRTQALTNFVGLFDEVSESDVTGSELLDNLRGQVAAFDDWQANLADLAAKGVDEGLIGELRQMGPKAGPQIAALNTLTDEQLTEYVTLWREKNRSARLEAIDQLKQQKVEMQQQLQEIRWEAYRQLEAYRVEWEKKNAEIRKNADDEMLRIEDRFKTIAEAGTNYGVALMDNFTGGIQSRADRLRSVLESMAAMVDSYMPHSPAKVGPLTRLNEWGPALVQSLADGIQATLPTLERVMNNMASIPSVVTLGLAGGNSGGDTNTTTQYNTGGNTIHITVQDGDDLLRTLHKLGVRLP